jgi:serine protease 16
MNIIRDYIIFFPLLINCVYGARASLPPLPLSLKSLLSDGSEYFFNQTLDHANPHSKKVFQQRYYINSENYKEGGPVFLYIGGESELNPAFIQSGLPATLAKTYNGALFGLEHRYYGKSLPFEELTAKNLKYLTSEQALNDLVHFVRNIQNPITKKKFDLKTRFITIGGSYAGELSAWARMSFPEVFLGAHASSAPLNVKDDFFEYDQEVQKAIGSDCLPYFKEVSDFAESIILSKDNEKIKNMKKLLTCEEIEDPMLFLYTLSDLVSSIVQYSNPSMPNNIETVCEGFKKTEEGDARFKYFSDVFKKELDKLGKTCYQFTSYDSLVNVKPDPSSSFRQWTYQSCNEFGYWQTAVHGKGKKSLRSKLLTKEWFQEFYCGPEIFGEKIGPSITGEINDRLAKNGTVPNIIWVNGERDPWKSLSITEKMPDDLGQPVFIIKDGSHVTDLGPDYPKDSKSLKEVRQKVIEVIGGWLKEN